MSCTGLSSSPSTTAASTVVVKGSKVDRIDAVVGPTRFSPAKNASIATTVDTTAMQPIQNHPPGSKSRLTPPVTAARTVSEAAAPVITRAESGTGCTWWTVVSATRM